MADEKGVLEEEVKEWENEVEKARKDIHLMDADMALLE